MTNKTIAKKAAADLFREILAFRDHLAPSGSQEARNRIARQSVMLMRRGSVKFDPPSATGQIFDVFNRRSIEGRRKTRLVSLDEESVRSLSDLSSKELENFTETKKRELKTAPLGKDEALRLSMIVEEAESDQLTPRQIQSNQMQQFRSERKHGDSKPPHLESDLSFVEFLENCSSDSSPDCDSSSDCEPSALITQAIEEPWDKNHSWDVLSDSLISQQSSDQEEPSEPYTSMYDPLHGQSLEEKKEQKKLARSQFLTREMIQIFLGEETDQFMKAVDRGGASPFRTK